MFLNLFLPESCLQSDKTSVNCVALIRIKIGQDKLNAKVISLKPLGSTTLHAVYFDHK